MLITMTKMCVRCRQVLPVEDFHLDSHRKGGRQSKCKKCQYARYKERLAEDPDKVRRIARESARRNRRRQLYGVSDDEFDEMVTVQDGRCATCLKVPPLKVVFADGLISTKGGLVVDHDHSTGVIRGLLCHNCNRALGLLGDDVETLRRAADYIAGTSRLAV